VRTTNARTPVAARQGGYVSRRATPTGASVAARATCELVRAYTDAKLACGVWEGGVVSRGNPTYPHNDQFR
jgi:hypothetical protein